MLDFIVKMTVAIVLSGMGTYAVLTMIDNYKNRIGDNIEGKEKWEANTK